MHKSQREELSRNNFNNKVANRGRLWVFAGVLMMTTWQGNQMLVHADETKTDSTSNDASSVTSNASQLSAKTVALSSAKNSADSSSVSTNSSATSGTSTSSTSAATVSSTSAQSSETATSAVVGSSSEKGQSSSTTATSASASADKTSQAGRTVAVLSADTQKSSAAAVNTATATPVSSGSDAAQANAQQAQTSQPATGNQTVTTAVAAIDSTVDGTTNTELVNEMVSQNSPVMAGKMMTTMAMTSSDQRVTNKRAALLRAAVVAADIDAGTDWNIDSSGVLHLNTGVLTANTASKLNDAWTPNAAKITAISIDSPVTAGTSTANLFKNLNQVTTINGLTNLDTSQSTSFADMFFGMTNLASLDLSSFKTSHVTNLGNMFLGDSNLTSLNVSGWNTSKVTNMSRTFNTCQKLTNLDLSSWDTSAATNMDSMFFADSGLTSLNLKNWNVSQVTSLTNIFVGDTALATLNVTGWQLNSKITSLNKLFAGLKSLTELDADNFSASAATTVDNLFNGDVALTTLNVNNWNLSSVTSLKSLWQALPELTTVKAANWQVGQVTTAFQILYNDPKLTTVDLSDWQTDSLTTIRGAFNQDTSLTSVNLANWETSKVTDMGYLFHDDSVLTDLALTNWKTDSLSIADSMFSKTSSLTAVDVGNWDTSHLQNAANMFGNMTNLTDLDTSKWKLDQLTDANDMFNEDTKLATLDTSGWGLSNLQNAYAMFRNMTNLTDLDTSKWKLDQLTDASDMFYGDAKLATLDTSGWILNNLQNAGNMFGNVTNLTDLDTSKWKLDQLTDASDMFYGDTKLTTLDTSGWGLGNLQNAYAMFNGDQALVMLDTSHWNLSNVTQSHFMFANDVSLTNLDTSQWGLGKDTNTQEMFAGDVALTTLGQTNWDLNQVTDASDMFNNDPLLASLNTKDWAINGPINVTKMFTCDTSLKTLDLSNWDLSSATAITDMLLGTPTLQELKLGSKVAFLTSDQSAVIGDAPLNDTYTGKWINTTGQTFTAAELMQLYNDTSTAVADTYVWQKDQTNVTVRDSVVDQSGQNTWSAADNFDSATDANGLSVTVTDSTVTGQVDTTIPGTYQVTYSILNAAGNVVKAIATVKVVASQVSVAAHDTTVMQGQAWQVADTFDSATDFEGQPVDFSQVVVTGADQVETKTPGTYDVTYRYTDSRGNVATKIIMVTVTPSQVAVTAKNMTVMQGQTWQAADAFVNASDATGQSVALSAVKVTGAVDTQTPGQYQVIYRYTDAYGNQASQVATITVEKSAVAIAANDVTVMQGQPWTSAESFVSATDANGDPVDLSAVTVTGADAVDTKTAGRYPVTYSYMDKYGNQASKVVTVVVKKSAVAIEANGMTIMQNQSWTPADAFVSANDANGQPVAFSQVTVVGANRVAIQTPGSYELTYRYTDAYGNTASKNVVLTVKASQVAVVANDTSLMQGQSWAAADSFVSATDAQGQLVQLNKVVVSGEKQVTTTVPGVYRVTYRNTDIYGNVATKTITVTIKASQVAIDAKNVTLTQGQAWTPADSFVSAHTADGQTLDFKQVSVLGADQVNVKVPGTYAVTYRATDSYGNSVQKTILVTVKASQLGLTVKNMTVKQGTAWTAADALVSATDAAGQAVGLTQLKVIGTVDTSKVGSYPVRYQNTDIYSNQIERTAMITVTPTSLNHSASKPNKSQPIVEPGQAAVVKSAKTPTRSNRSISTRTNAKQNSVETDQAAVIAKVETTKQPTSKLGETHSKAHAKAAKATSLPQTGESSANGAAALGALAISFTGLLSFFNKKRRN